jgi:hypothetical protein
MEIDLDQIVSQVTQWDLKIKLKGKKYVVACPSMGHIIAMEKQTPEEFRQQFAGLFDGPAPDCNALSVEQVAAVVATIGAAVRKYSEGGGKFGPLVSQAIAEAIAAGL